MDWWLHYTFWDGRGRPREKRACQPFRERAAGERYIDRFLTPKLARREIWNVYLVPEESGFYAHIDRPDRDALERHAQRAA